MEGHGDHQNEKVEPSAIEKARVGELLDKFDEFSVPFGIEPINRKYLEDELEIFPVFKFDDGLSQQEQLTILVGTGDEGGPSILIGIWSNWMTDESDWALEVVFHKFDLKWQKIWDREAGFGKGD